MATCSCGAVAREEHEGRVVCTSCGRVFEAVLEMGGERPSESLHSQLLMSELVDWCRVELRVQDMGEQLGLPYDCIQMAVALTKSSLGKPRTGAPLESHAACSLLLASRRMRSVGLTLTLRDVAARASCPPVRIGRCWLKLLGRLAAEQKRQLVVQDSSGAGAGQDNRVAVADADRRPGVRSTTLDESALLCQYLDTLHRAGLSRAGPPAAAGQAAGTPSASSSFLPASAAGAEVAPFAPGGAVRLLALKLLDLAAAEWLLDGRYPENVAVGTILVALASLSLKAGGMSTEAVCAALGIAPSKVKRRTKELRTVALSVARALPGRSDLADRHLLRGLSSALEQARLERAAAALALDEESEEEEDHARRGAESAGSSSASTEEAPPATPSASACALTRAGACDVGGEGSSSGAGRMRGPPSFHASAAKRARLESKLGAAKRRLGDGDFTEGAEAGEYLDIESRRLEAALRRGVPEEALLQGHFEAVPLAQDKEVSEAEAPHLFSEELSERDMLETAASVYLRSEPLALQDGCVE